MKSTITFSKNLLGNNPMQTTELKNIQVAPDRQRRKFDPAAIDKLALSILDRGLLHPVVVRMQEDRHVLVAGERRLRAIEAIAVEQKHFRCNGINVPVGHVPYILITDLDEIAYREAELEENLIREDLTWQEEADAIAELHTLRKAQNPQQTYTDTAREISPEPTPGHTTYQDVSRSVIIAQHLDDPKVAAARDEKEAFAIVSRKLEQEFRSQLHAAVPASHNHTLIHGDLTEEMWNLEIDQFTCMIADPPYGKNAGGFGDAAKLSHEYEDSPEHAMELYDHILAYSRDCCAADAHIYLFCDVLLLPFIRERARHYEWNLRATPLIWDKVSRGHLDSGGLYGWRRSYEMIVFASRGSRNLTSVADDVVSHKYGFKEGEKEHAAQKPVDLYKRLLSLSTAPGDKVLDPCCGSGTIFAAAHELKLEATGIEQSDEYHAIALNRLNGLE